MFSEGSWPRCRKWRRDRAGLRREPGRSRNQCNTCWEPTASRRGNMDSGTEEVSPRGRTRGRKKGRERRGSQAQEQNQMCATEVVLGAGCPARRNKTAHPGRCGTIGSSLVANFSPAPRGGGGSRFPAVLVGGLGVCRADYVVPGGHACVGSACVRPAGTGRRPAVRMYMERVWPLGPRKPHCAGWIPIFGDRLRPAPARPARRCALARRELPRPRAARPALDGRKDGGRRGNRRAGGRG